MNVQAWPNDEDPNTPRTKKKRKDAYVHEGFLMLRRLLIDGTVKNAKCAVSMADRCPPCMHDRYQYKRASLPEYRVSESAAGDVPNFVVRTGLEPQHCEEPGFQGNRRSLIFDGREYFH